MALMTGSTGELIRSILSAQPYKPGQGLLARNGTLAALGVLIAFGVYSWSTSQAQAAPVVKWGIPLVLGGVLGWIAYRMIHYPRFADFLISTEAEMNKVSWPSKGELRASTMVVLANVIFLALFLFLTDLFWRMVLGAIGILKIGSLFGGGGSGM